MNERPAMRSIDSIVVGERFRSDMGDLEGLARSIAQVGLLHPPVITPDGRLIAGKRRVAAFRVLGWREAPVTIVDLREIMRGEHAENVHRKDFTLSEAVAVKRALEPLERHAAKERQREGGQVGGKGSGKLPEASKGNAADKAAKVAGMARRRLEKAEAVVDAAEAEPKRFGKLLADMDRTGRANGVYRRLQNIKAADAIRASPPPLPRRGPYAAGLIDIPWAYELLGETETALTRGVLPYPTMTLADACAFPVSSLLAPDAAIGVWVTNFILLEGLHIPLLAAWQLKPKALITWPKDYAGRGYWAKGQTEHFVIATRGKPTVTLSDQTTLLKGPFHLVRRGAHSAKPLEAYVYFESLYPAPRYFDLFSRYRHNERWDPWGFEAPPANGGDGGAGMVARTGGDSPP
jgi:N6-adenosine-specific RNA methylase IME4